MNKQSDKHTTRDFINWFRDASPYVNAHRGSTFVIAFGGEALLDKHFDTLIHDIAILNSLGIRLVVVYGARPQIEKRLAREQIEPLYKDGLRITDSQSLECVKEAVGSVRVEIESLLSMGIANTPMAGAHLRVASGNFVTAQPMGVRDGVDFQHTGIVRRIDIEAISQRLNNGDIVLLSPSGYSPTGEIFNLSAEDVATTTAIELQADKLIFMLEGGNLVDAKRKLIREISPAAADRLLDKQTKLPEELRIHLRSAIHACRFNVRRAHLIQRKTDGALLQELFTRDGVGTLITGDTIEVMRAADINDVGGIIELLKPMEETGVLVRRSRELLEIEISQYTIIEREGMIVGCAALYPYHKERVAELACLSVHPEYQDAGRGESMLVHIEKQAVALGMKKLLILTTQTAHWFQEKGFVETNIKSLPVKRKNLYNAQRKSKIFYKNL